MFGYGQKWVCFRLGLIGSFLFVCNVALSNYCVLLKQIKADPNIEEIIHPHSARFSNDPDEEIDFKIERDEIFEQYPNDTDDLIRARVFDPERPQIIWEQLKMEDVGVTTGRAVSPRRTKSNLENPVVDVDEIRLRQKAVRELMENESFLTGLKQNFENASWHKRLYSHKDTEPNVLEIYPFFRRTDDPERLTDIINQKLAFFDDIERLSEILESAKSARLRGLRWILSAVSNAEHPYEIKPWITEFRSKDRLAQRDMVLALSEEQREVIHKIESAYAELGMYYDVARDSKEKGWTVFPRVLTKDPEKGPKIHFKDGHSLTQLEKVRKEEDTSAGEPEVSVPNTVRMGRGAHQTWIIVGPNNGGKSTFSDRTVPQLLMRASLGSPLPISWGEYTPVKHTVNVNPPDDPGNGRGKFKSESAVLWWTVVERAKRDPFTLNILDEVLPGTIREIREDTERAVLLYLAKNTDSLSLVPTHNWTTADLGDEFPETFGVFRVEDFQLKPGLDRNLIPMYEASVEVLKESGFPREVYESVLEMGRARQRENSTPLQ